MLQLISGLEFIHKMNISHRDLKLENILVDPETSTTKLIDFGFAVKSDSFNQL
jgi:serine/threonine protein kinase